jgi:hypothetical protein
MPGRMNAIGRLLKRALIHFLVFTAALVTGLLLYANVVDLPRPIVSRVLASMSRGAFAFEAGAARLRGILSVRLTDVAMYRKQVLGDPMLESDVIYVRISPLAWMRQGAPVSSVVANHVVWRPKQGKSRKRRPPRPLRRRLAFRAQARSGRIYDVMLTNVACRVEGLGEKITAGDIEATLSAEGVSGRLSGQIGFDLMSRVMSCRVVSNFDPRIVKSFLFAHEMDFCRMLIERFSFEGEPPLVEWGFEWLVQEKGDIHVTGDFRMRDCTYCGVGLLRADGSVTVDRRGTNTFAELNNLFVVRREGMANVAFAVRPDEKRIEFDAESSLQPLAMGRMVGGLTNLLAKQVLFEGASTVVARGTLDYGGTHAGTDLRGSVQADRVAVGPFRCESGSCDIFMRGTEVTLTNIAAIVCGGTASGNVVLEVPPGGLSNVQYRADIRARGLDFEKFMQTVSTQGEDREYKGRLSGELQVTGRSGPAFDKTLNGKGRVRVSDGRVFMLPIFGGLSRLMTQVIPGLDFVLRQSDANCRFSIRDGRINTDKVAIEGDILSLSGRGAYDIGGDLDFDVQLKLLKEHTFVAKLVRVLTYPISKLFEFRLKGPLDDPKWYPVNFSFDLLERIGLRKTDSESEPEQKSGGDSQEEGDVEVIDEVSD